MRLSPGLLPVSRSIANLFRLSGRHAVTGRRYKLVLSPPVAHQSFTRDVFQRQGFMPPGKNILSCEFVVDISGTGNMVTWDDEFLINVHSSSQASRSGVLEPDCN